MKNIYILKGWFNMEEIKNGVISEEALEEIAGGLKISKSTVKKALTAAGVIVGALGAIGGGVGGGYLVYDKFFKNKTVEGPKSAGQAPAAGQTPEATVQAPAEQTNQIQ